MTRGGWTSWSGRCFAASCQEYRPLALVVVCQRFDAGALAAVRAALGPILAIVPEVGFTLLNHEGGAGGCAGGVAERRDRGGAGAVSGVPGL